ncbi:MAG TPA: permease-like cell division protein FtsX [Actinomycetota bacterium]|nr:permease-like cell division protein FtsX [Actinomycetota bacterium]
MALKVGYFVREATTNLRRNKLMTVAAVLTAGVSLLLLGGVLTLGDFVSSITREIESKVEVSVFLADTITDSQQQDVKRTLEGLDVVRRVSYVSKDEAFKEFKELYRDQPALWENIDADVLPASFRVELAEPERVDVVRSKLDRNPAVEEIADQRETVQRLVRFTDLLRTFSVVMIIVLLGAAVLLISNTTQLAIYARRREIEIQKLVGATNWFVRLPFMLEGITAGVAGAVIALFLLAVGKSIARSQFPVWIPTTALHGIAFGQTIWLVMLGVIVGALGSALAVRRFLEV